MTPSSPLARHSTGTGKLLVDVADGVAVVTFNNPGKRNALSSEIRAALPGLLGGAAGRRRRPRRGPHRRRGQGVRLGRRHLRVRRAAHLARRPRRLRPRPGATQPALGQPGQAGHRHDPRLLHRRRACSPPLQADIRIASDDSQFGIPAARLGLGYRFAGVTALVDLVGPAWASEILFSARRFPAAEALQIGLVNRVVPAADLRDEVMSLAQDIAAERARSPSPRARRRSARRASPPTGATWPGSRRWSRPASARRTTSRASAPSPRSARPPSPGADAALRATGHRAREAGRPAHSAVFAEVWCGGRRVQPCRPPAVGNPARAAHRLTARVRATPGRGRAHRAGQCQGWVEAAAVRLAAARASGRTSPAARANPAASA